MPERFSIDLALALGGTIAGVAAMVWITHAPTPREKQMDAFASEHRVAEPFDQGTTERDTQLMALAADPATVSTGAEAFQRYCQACHQPETTQRALKLFDGAWFHGSTPAAIESTAREGFLPAGMIGWEGIVPDEQLTAAVAYLVAWQVEIAETTDAAP